MSERAKQQGLGHAHWMEVIVIQCLKFDKKGDCRHKEKETYGLVDADEDR